MDTLPLSSFLIFGSVLHACLIFVFFSLQGQIVGIAGPNGLSPAISRIRAAKARLSDEGHDPQSRKTLKSRLRLFMLCPTMDVLFKGEDATCTSKSLRAQCFAGIGFAFLGALGVLPHFLTAAICAALYLSLITAGGDFMALQWDSLVVEVSALYAISSALVALQPFSPLVLGLARFSILNVLFRLVFCSGVCKLASGCATWRGLKAMEFHYWTQPLPHIGAWYAYNLVPAWAHRLTTLSVLVMELAIPLLMLIPGTLAARAVTLGVVALMGGIVATGSYGFFNILTISLTTLYAHHFGFGIQHAEHTVHPSSAPLQALVVACLGVLTAALVLYNVLSVVPLLLSLRTASLGVVMDKAILRLRERIANPGRDPGMMVDTIRRALHQANERVRSHNIRIIILDEEGAAIFGTAFAFKGRDDDDARIFETVDLPEGTYNAQELLAEERDRVLRDRMQHGGEHDGNPTAFIKYTQCCLREPVLQVELAILRFVNWAFVDSRLREYVWGAMHSAFVALAPLHVMSMYGLFAVMTTHRYEIVLERSTDCKDWTGVAFRWKPGRVWEENERLPSSTLYHMPRLDWALWFLPLDASDAAASMAGMGASIVPKQWFRALLKGIAEENPDIVALLKDFRPWPKEATRRYVRASLWKYTFSQRDADGKWPSTWWSREPLGDYSQPYIYNVPEHESVDVSHPQYQHHHQHKKRSGGHETEVVTTTTESLEEIETTIGGKKERHSRPKGEGMRLRSRRL